MKTRSYFALGAVLAIVAVFFFLRARSRHEGSAGNASSAAGRKAASRTPRGIQWSGEGEDAPRRGGDALTEIQGRVVDALDGTAIESASVSLRDDDGEIVLATESEADGSFSFPVSKSARVLSAAADGYAFLTETIDAAHEGETVLALDPAVRVRGKVVDARGQPVAGAEVWIEDEEGDNWDRWPRPASDVATSGADGSFSIEDAPSGKLLALATHEGHAPGEAEIGGVGPGRSRESVTIALHDAGVLTGLVLLDGAPVEGAIVTVQSEEDPHSATSGPGGMYRIEGLAPGKVQVLAQNAIGRGIRYADIPEGGETKVDIGLTATGTISGHVLDADGKPLAGASVHVSDARGNFENRILVPSSPVKSGPDGAFLLEGIPAGRAMRVWASLDLYRTGSGVDGVAGGEVNLVLELGITLTGTVETSDGRSFPGRARVMAVRRGSGWMSRREEVAAKGGKFRIEGIEEGEWELTAEAAGFSPSAPAGVTIGKNTPGPVKLIIGAKGSVHGRLVSRDGGPVAGARVSVSHPLRTRLPGEDSVRLEWGDSVRSDSQGRFVLGAGAGGVQLFIYHPEFSAEVLRTSIPPDGDIDLGTIELRPGAGASAIFEFSGIGAVLATDEQGVGIRSVLPESPAARAGVRAGDRVLGVDGTAVTGMDLEELITRIRGPVGTTVSLSLGRDGNAEPLRIDVVREKLRA